MRSFQRCKLSINLSFQAESLNLKGASAPVSAPHRRNSSITSASVSSLRGELVTGRLERRHVPRSTSGAEGQRSIQGSIPQRTMQARECRSFDEVSVLKLSFSNSSNPAYHNLFSAMLIRLAVVASIESLCSALQYRDVLTLSTGQLQQIADEVQQQVLFLKLRSALPASATPYSSGTAHKSRSNSKS